MEATSSSSEACQSLSVNGGQRHSRWGSSSSSRREARCAGLAAFGTLAAVLLVSISREGRRTLRRSPDISSALIVEEEAEGEKSEDQDLIMSTGNGHVSVVTERCFWHSCGANTVCRLSSEDSTIDGRNTTDVLNISSLHECKQKCEKAGEHHCKGVEYNDDSHRCELWSRPILAHRSCITGESCPEAKFSCHTKQCKAIDKPSDLPASERSFKDGFGGSVSISGDTAIVGAPGDNDRGSWSGAAYVFVRQGNEFVEQAKLTAEDGFRNANMGNSVGISGDIAIVGAYKDNEDSGAAYIFRRDYDVWEQETKIVPDDGAKHSHFGYRVCIFGDQALVSTQGNPDKNTSGAVYIFAKTDDDWTQIAKLESPHPKSRFKFGSSLSLSADTAMVGAHEEADEDGHGNGVVYAFTRINHSWSGPVKLVANNTHPGDHFGNSVSLSGNMSLIGAYRRDAKGKSSGTAYIFTRKGNRWTETHELEPDGLDADDWFGYSVGLSGNTAVIGAPGDEHHGVDRSGSAYVFVQAGEHWVQQSKLSPKKVAAGALFGHVTSISGPMAIFAAQEEAKVFPAALSQACPG